MTDKSQTAISQERFNEKMEALDSANPEPLRKLQMAIGQTKIHSPGIRIVTDADLLRHVLDCLGLTQRSAALAFGIDDRVFRRWCSGDDIPAEWAAWFRDMAAFLDAHPMPEGE